MANDYWRTNDSVLWLLLSQWPYYYYRNRTPLTGRIHCVTCPDLLLRRHSSMKEKKLLWREGRPITDWRDPDQPTLTMPILYSITMMTGWRDYGWRKQYYCVIYWLQCDDYCIQLIPNDDDWRGDVTGWVMTDWTDPYSVNDIVVWCVKK